MIKVAIPQNEVKIIVEIAFFRKKNSMLNKYGKVAPTFNQYPERNSLWNSQLQLAQLQRLENLDVNVQSTHIEC